MPAVDVRIGSTANALQPVSSAERSLGAGRAEWVILVLVAGAAVLADQLTKQVVGRTPALGDSVDILGPFSIHHVQNSGIAFGLFGSRTPIVIGVTAVAVGAMLVFFARSGRRHPVLRNGYFLRGEDYMNKGYPDIAWHGLKIGKPDWSSNSRVLAFLLGAMMP